PSVYCPDFYSLIPRPPMSTLFSYTTLFRSDNFFAVETYATICFKSVSVSKTNNGYSTTGELSIHGVTKTVTIPFTFKNNTFIGTIEIPRLEYKIGEDYGSFRVGKTASVTITCVVKS